ncbi:MAG: DUF2589 domain-containing protein [Bacteroidia bacterium]|nr:DUF2589 domain-containing protein [Bacteroidia bacterium]
MANPGTELAALDFGNLIGGPLNAVITAQAMAAQSTATFIKDVGFYKEGTMINGVDVGNTPVYVDFKYPKEIMPYQPGKIWLKVFSIELINGGSGYDSSDLISLINDGTEEATADISGFTITVDDTTKAITAIIPATGFDGGKYITPPTAKITKSGGAVSTGTGATITVKTNIQSIDNPVSAVYQDMKFSVPILTMLPIPFIKVDIITIDFNAKITSMETQNQSEDLSVGVNLEVKQRWPSGSAKLNVAVAYKKSSSSGSSIERTYSMAIHVQASQDEMPDGMQKLLGILEGAMISTPGAITSGN